MTEGPGRAGDGVGSAAGRAWRVVRATAATDLRRMARDRSSFFFALVLPVMIVVIVGATFPAGGDDALDLAVLDADGTTASGDLVAAVAAAPAVELRRAGDLASLRRDVRRGRVDGGLVVPAGYGAALRRGEAVRVPLVVDPTDPGAAAVRTAVGGVVAREGAVASAASFAVVEAGAAFADAVELAREQAERTASVRIREVATGGPEPVEPNRYAYVVPGMLVLFTFITSATGATWMVDSRLLGVSRRLLAGPVTVAQLLAAQAAARFTIAATQAALLVVIGALAFGIDWGRPAPAAALVLAFVLVGTGAGMLVGAWCRTPEQASVFGAPAGIVLGMLGGCMWPLEIVPDPVRILGHLFPHAWAMDGWVAVVFDGGGLGDVALELAVLAGFAAVALAGAATVLARRVALGTA